MVKIEELIITDITMRGTGTTTPFRLVFEVYNKNGDLLASKDPCADFTIYEMVEFSKHCRENFNEDILCLLKEWKRPEAKYPYSKW